jgi:hypothetical protein
MLFAAELASELAELMAWVAFWAAVWTALEACCAPVDAVRGQPVIVTPALPLAPMACPEALA